MNSSVPLKTILEGCQSTDNTYRAQAEQLLKQQMDNGGINFVYQLLEEANGSDGSNGLAAVMARRMMKKVESINPEFIQLLQERSLGLLTSKLTNFRQKKSVCQFIESFTLASEQNEWNDLDGFLITCLQSSDVVFQKTALFLMKILIEVREDMKNTMGTILPIVCTCLNKPELDIQLEAFGCLVAVATCVDTDLSGFGLPRISLKILERCLESGDERNSTKMFEYLIELIQTNFELFIPNLHDFPQLMSQIILNRELDSDIREFGIRTLTEMAKKDPEVCSGVATFVSRCFDTFFAVMLEIEYIPNEWEQSRTINICMEHETLFESAEVAIYEFSEAVCGESSKETQNLFQTINNFVYSESWQEKHAGLVAVIQCLSIFEAKGVSVEQILELVQNCVEDQSPRVRFAVSNCIGVLCRDYTSGITNQAANIVNILCHIIENDTSCRVKCHAIMCLNNFYEHKKLSVKQLSQYVEKIVNSIQKVVSQHGTDKHVQECVCCTIAELVSPFIDTDYTPVVMGYFESFISFCRNVINMCNTDNQRDIDLKLEALRTVSYLGKIAEKESFSAHVDYVMQESSRLSNVKGIDEIKLFHIWGRTSEIMGEDFDRYLGDITMLCNNIFEQDLVLLAYDSGDEETVEFGVGDVALDASKVEWCETALELLQTLSQSCPRSFTKYSSDLLPKVAEFSTYKYHSGIREHASDALMGFVQGAIQIEQYDFAINTILSLNEILLNDTDISIKDGMIDKIYDLFDTNRELVKQIFGQNHLSTIFQTHITLISTAHLRIQGRIQQLKIAEDEIDEHMLKEENEEEEKLLKSIANFIHLCFKIYGTDLLQILQSHMGTLQDTLNQGHTMQQYTVVLIFADIVEYCDKNIIEDFTRTLLPSFYDSIKSKDIDLRESGFYGLKSVIDKFPEMIQQNHSDILNISFLQFDEANNGLAEDGNIEVLCDICSAVILKILVTFENQLSKNLADLYRKFLDVCLPLREDEMVCRVVLKEMARLLQMQHEAFLGPQMFNLHTIMKELIIQYQTERMLDETDDQVKQFFLSLRDNNESLLLQIASILDEETTEKLETLFSD